MKRVVRRIVIAGSLATGLVFFAVPGSTQQGPYQCERACVRAAAAAAAACQGEQVCLALVEAELQDCLANCP